MTTPAQIERAFLQRGNKLTIAWRPAAPFDAGVWVNPKRIGDVDVWHDDQGAYQRGTRGLTARDPHAGETVPCRSCAKPVSVRHVTSGAFNPLCRTCARPAPADPADVLARAHAAVDALLAARPANAPRPAVPTLPERPRGDDAVLDAVAWTGPDAATDWYPGQRGRRVGPRRTAHGILGGPSRYAPGAPKDLGPRRGGRRAESRARKEARQHVAELKLRRQVQADLARLTERGAPAEVVEAYRLVRLERRTQLEAGRAASPAVTARTIRNRLKTADGMLG